MELVLLFCMLSFCAGYALSVVIEIGSKKNKSGLTREDYIREMKHDIRRMTIAQFSEWLRNDL